MLGISRRDRCRHVARLLWEYEAGSLHEADSRRVAAHLAACPACRRESAGYSRTVSLLGAARELDAPDSARNWAELRARLESEARSRERVRPIARRPALSWAAAAAAVSALALAAHWVLVQQAVPHGGGQGFHPTTAAPAPSPGDTRQVAQNPPQPDQRLISVMQRDSIARKTHKAEIHTAFERERVDLGSPRRSGARRAKPHPKNMQPPRSQPTGRDKGARLYLASLDGAGTPSQPRRDYVMAPAAGAPDPGTQRDYVIGEIPASGHRITTVSYGGGGERPVW